MQQRSSIKTNQGRINMSDFYELKETSPPPPPPPPSPQFKIPSSTSLLAPTQGEPSLRHHQTMETPMPPSHQQPSQVRFSYQKLGGGDRHHKSSSHSSSDENSLLSNPRNIHCVVIADHIMDCPICSRFYRNYTPIYNLIILILGIALIVLIIKCNNKNIPMQPVFTRPTPPPPTI
jgi:hypothetical protein